jgi:hypothetical protein
VLPQLGNSQIEVSANLKKLDTEMESPTATKPDNYFKQLAILTILSACIINCYWITLYNVPNLGGNKFINGMILGVAEMSSGVISGFIMSKFSNRMTY